MNRPGVTRTGPDRLQNSPLDYHIKITARRTQLPLLLLENRHDQTGNSYLEQAKLFFSKQTILQIAHQHARTISQSDNKTLIKTVKN
jgi:hypothetical protein